MKVKYAIGNLMIRDKLRGDYPDLSKSQDYCGIDIEYGPPRVNVNDPLLGSRGYWRVCSNQGSNLYFSAYHGGTNYLDLLKCFNAVYKAHKENHNE